jgi:hypothetical protein
MIALNFLLMQFVMHIPWQNTSSSSAFDIAGLMTARCAETALPAAEEATDPGIGEALALPAHITAQISSRLSESAFFLRIGARYPPPAFSTPTVWDHGRG